MVELTTDDPNLSSGLVGVRSWNSHILVDYMTISDSLSTNVPIVPTHALGNGISLESIFVAQVDKNTY